MMEDKQCQKELAIVLPSLDPDKKFSAVVEGLLTSGFAHIVIVDDGSSAGNKAYFEAAAAHEQ